MHLGKYQLIRKLATGGMAEVFLAKARGPHGFEKSVVVKRVLPHLAEDPQFIQMFLTEARLAAQLNHPNVVHIFDFGEADGEYYLAMEYIDGPDLRILGSSCEELGISIPLPVAAKIVSLACEGLAYAHDLKDAESGQPLRIVHRDMSSDNILVARNGSVKVVDFGIAKAVTQVHTTQAGFIKGKIAYMSREQLMNKPLDARTDVYSLGVVLYELVTGTHPYRGDSDVALMQAIIHDPPTPVTAQRADLPFRLRRIIDTAIAKDRDDRYPNCHEMQADLEQFILEGGRLVGSAQMARLVAQVDGHPDAPERAPPRRRSPPIRRSPKLERPKSPIRLLPKSEEETRVAPPPVDQAPPAAAPARVQKKQQEGAFASPDEWHSSEAGVVIEPRDDEAPTPEEDAPDGGLGDQVTREHDAQRVAHARNQRVPTPTEQRTGSAPRRVIAAAAVACALATTGVTGYMALRHGPSKLDPASPPAQPAAPVAVAESPTTPAPHDVPPPSEASDPGPPPEESTRRHGAPPAEQRHREATEQRRGGAKPPEREDTRRRVRVRGSPTRATKRTPVHEPEPTVVEAPVYDAGVAVADAGTVEMVPAAPRPDPARYASLSAPQRALMQRCDRIEERLAAVNRPAPSLIERLQRVRSEVPSADTKHQQNVLAAALDSLEFDQSAAIQPAVAIIPARPPPEQAASSAEAAHPAVALPCVAGMAAECARLHERLNQLRQRFESSKPVSRAVALSKLIGIRSKIETLETLGESASIASELDAWEREFIPRR